MRSRDMSSLGRRKRPGGRIVVGMLVIGRGDEGSRFGPFFFGGRSIRQMPQAVCPGQSSLYPMLVDGRERLGMIERADRNADPVAVDIAKCQWRAAVAAKASIDLVGRAKQRDFAACNGKGLPRPTHKRGVEGAKCLLAHAAVADMGATGLCIETI